MTHRGVKEAYGIEVTCNSDKIANLSYYNYSNIKTVKRRQKISLKVEYRVN